MLRINILSAWWAVYNDPLKEYVSNPCIHMYAILCYGMVLMQQIEISMVVT